MSESMQLRLGWTRVGNKESIFVNKDAHGGYTFCPTRKKGINLKTHDGLEFTTAQEAAEWLAQQRGDPAAAQQILQAFYHHNAQPKAPHHVGSPGHHVSSPGSKRGLLEAAAATSLPSTAPAAASSPAKVARHAGTFTTISSPAPTTVTARVPMTIEQDGQFIYIPAGHPVVANSHVPLMSPPQQAPPGTPCSPSRALAALTLAGGTTHYAAPAQRSSLCPAHKPRNSASTAQPAATSCSAADAVHSSTTGDWSWSEGRAMSYMSHSSEMDVDGAELRQAYPSATGLPGCEHAWLDSHKNPGGDSIEPMQHEGGKPHDPTPAAQLLFDPAWFASLELAGTGVGPCSIPEGEISPFRFRQVFGTDGPAPQQLLAAHVGRQTAKATEEQQQEGEEEEDAGEAGDFGHSGSPQGPSSCSASELRQKASEAAAALQTATSPASKQQHVDAWLEYTQQAVNKERRQQHAHGHPAQQAAAPAAALGRRTAAATGAGIARQQQQGLHLAAGLSALPLDNSQAAAAVHPGLGAPGPYAAAVAAEAGGSSGTGAGQPAGAGEARGRPGRTTASSFGGGGEGDGGSSSSSSSSGGDSDDESDPCGSAEESDLFGSADEQEHTPGQAGGAAPAPPPLPQARAGGTAPVAVTALTVSGLRELLQQQLPSSQSARQHMTGIRHLARLVHGDSVDKGTVLVAQLLPQLGVLLQHLRDRVSGSIAFKRLPPCTAASHAAALLRVLGVAQVQAALQGPQQVQELATAVRAVHQEFLSMANANTAAAAAQGHQQQQELQGRQHSGQPTGQHQHQHHQQHVASNGTGATRAPSTPPLHPQQPEPQLAAAGGKVQQPREQKQQQQHPQQQQAQPRQALVPPAAEAGAGAVNLLQPAQLPATPALLAARPQQAIAASPAVHPAAAAAGSAGEQAGWAMVQAAAAKYPVVAGLQQLTFQTAKEFEQMDGRLQQAQQQVLAEQQRAQQQLLAEQQRAQQQLRAEQQRAQQQVRAEQQRAQQQVLAEQQRAQQHQAEAARLEQQVQELQAVSKAAPEPLDVPHDTQHLPYQDPLVQPCLTVGAMAALRESNPDITMNPKWLRARGVDDWLAKLVEVDPSGNQSINLVAVCRGSLHAEGPCPSTLTVTGLEELGAAGFGAVYAATVDEGGRTRRVAIKFGQEGQVVSSSTTATPRVLQKMLAEQSASVRVAHAAAAPSPSEQVAAGAPCVIRAGCAGALCVPLNADKLSQDRKRRALEKQQEEVELGRAALQSSRGFTQQQAEAEVPDAVDTGKWYWLVPFVELELLDGDLWRLLATGRRLTRQELSLLAYQVATGLAALHAVGILHRDLKDGNIVMRPAPYAVSVHYLLRLLLASIAVISDLGQASATRVAYGDDGTEQQMSPEQAAGLRHDTKADVFGFANIMLSANWGLLQADLWRSTPAPAQPGDIPDVPRCQLHDGAGILEALSTEPEDDFSDELGEFFQHTLAYHPQGRWDLDQVLKCGLVSRGRRLAQLLEGESTRAAELQECLLAARAANPGRQLSL